MKQEIKTRETEELDMSVDDKIQQLIITRMLIQAGSGGGKSWGIRFLSEQFSGKVQQFIIDWEGEFKTLRERFDFALVGRDDGADIQLVVDHAGVYAEKLYFSGLSVIFDLSDLGHKDRMRFVDQFLRRLMSFPLEKYTHALLVYLDEAHKYCPQMRVIGDAADAVIDAATMGRKREIGLIMATQRISKLHKDAAAECLNKLIGRTGQDVDQVRALDELGDKSITKQNLRRLKPGEFYGFGPALQDEVIKIKIGKVISHHGKPPAGWKIPVPAAIQEVVASLAGLPEEAQQDFDTMQALRSRVAKLNAEKHKLEEALEQAKALALPPQGALTLLEKLKKRAEESVQAKYEEVKLMEAAAEKDRADLAHALADLGEARKRYQRAETLLARIGHFIDNFATNGKRSDGPLGVPSVAGNFSYRPNEAAVRHMIPKPEEFAPHSGTGLIKEEGKLKYPVMGIHDFQKDAIAAVGADGKGVIMKFPTGLGKDGTDAPKPLTESPECQNFAPKQVITKTEKGIAIGTENPASTPLVIETATPVRWNKCEKTILEMLFGRDHWFDRYQISYYTGYSNTSGGFDQAIRHLQQVQLIRKVEDGYRFVDGAVDQIRQIVGHDPVKKWELTVDFYRPNMPKCTATILDLLNTHPSLALSRPQIAARTGYSVTSGGFDQSLRELVKLTLICRNDDGTYILDHNLR